MKVPPSEAGAVQGERALVKYERQGRIATITLDRPPVHALSLAMYQAMVDAIHRLNADEGAHVAILTSAGGKAFCAGADVKELQGLDSATRRGRHEFVSNAWVAIANADLPIIAAINGPAPGGGTVLASLCDWRVAAVGATFSMPEIDRGTAGGGGVFLRRLGMRESVVRDLLYTGRVCSAREALEIGLVDEVVPLAHLMPASMQRAEHMAAKPRASLVLMKKAILAAAAHSDWQAAYRATHGISAQMTGTPDSKEAINAFLEGRTRAR